MEGKNDIFKKWADIGVEPEKVTNLYATRDYRRFKFLDGNRDVKHYKKIMKSIKSVGILYQPILVNEKYEIIEGQGRFLASKELDLPVLYVQQPGIGIDEVIALNSCSSIWKIPDYVHRWAVGEGSTEGARYLDLLHQEFPEFGHKLLYGAATRTGVCNDGHRNVSFKNGKMDMNREQYEYGRKVMTYVKQFRPYFKKVQGRCDNLYPAVIFFYEHPDVDNKLLLKKVEKYYPTINPIATVRQAVTELQNVYNFGTRRDSCVYVESDYTRLIMRKGK